MIGYKCNECHRKQSFYVINSHKVSPKSVHIIKVDQYLDQWYDNGYDAIDASDLTMLEMLHTVNHIRYSESSEALNAVNRSRCLPVLTNSGFNYFASKALNSLVSQHLYESISIWLLDLFGVRVGHSDHSEDRVTTVFTRVQWLDWGSQQCNSWILHHCNRPTDQQTNTPTLHWWQ